MNENDKEGGKNILDLEDYDNQSEGMSSEQQEIEDESLNENQDENQD